MKNYFLFFDYQIYNFFLILKNRNLIWKVAADMSNSFFLAICFLEGAVLCTLLGGCWKFGTAYNFFYFLGFVTSLNIKLGHGRRLKFTKLDIMELFQDSKLDYITKKQEILLIA